MKTDVILTPRFESFRGFYEIIASAFIVLLSTVLGFVASRQRASVCRDSELKQTFQWHDPWMILEELVVIACINIVIHMNENEPNQQRLKLERPVPVAAMLRSVSQQCVAHVDDHPKVMENVSCFSDTNSSWCLKLSICQTPWEFSAKVLNSLELS